VSTSPTFKYRGPDKRCPFPFNRDEATELPSYYGYVTLTETDGDEGLAEACRLWWLIEEVVFTPTGSSVFNPTGGPYPIDIAFSGDAEAHPFGVEPADRVAFTNPLFPNILGNTQFSVAYVSSEWRLYYYFIFTAQYTDYQYYLTLFITSDAALQSSSGTFSLFGYTLTWYSRTEAFDELGNEYTMSFTNAGLTATSTFYTLV
jgi:hypothetical protein